MTRRTARMAKRPDVVIPLLQRVWKINQERGNNGDVEESVVNTTEPSVSVKWMTNTNQCHTKEICISAHQGYAWFHPGSTLLLNNTTENLAALQKILKAPLMRRAPVNMCCAKKHVLFRKHLGPDTSSIS